MSQEQKADNTAGESVDYWSQLCPAWEQGGPNFQAENANLTDACLMNLAGRMSGLRLVVMQELPFKK